MANSDSSVILALIGIVGTVIAGMFRLLAANTKALNKVAKASDKVAIATTKSANEAKQRNGHLGEQNLHLAKLVTSQNKDVASIKESNSVIAKILSKSAVIAAEDRDILTGTQVVEHQKVEHQTIQHEVVKK